MINRYKVPRSSGDIAMYSMDLIGGICFLLFLVPSFFEATCYLHRFLEKCFWGNLEIQTIETMDQQ